MVPLMLTVGSKLIVIVVIWTVVLIGIRQRVSIGHVRFNHKYINRESHPCLFYCVIGFAMIIALVISFGVVLFPLK